jgi:UDP-2,3-diacylglucosamine pyrophosphatase LpxH
MPNHVRAIFLSDSHLGQKFARGEELLAFLDAYEPDYLYLVGDFVDAWSLRWSGHWPPVYTQIVERIIELAALGTAVRYTPGNHDSFLRRIKPSIPGVQIADQFVHQTADQRRLLVIHGDLLDSIERQWKWLSRIGSFLFNRIIDLNLAVNAVLKWLQLRPRFFSFTIKRWSKRMLGAFGRFQRRLIEFTRQRGMDGIVCGHVHFPQIVQSDGILFINTGDWLENASALIEQTDGSLELVNHGRVIGKIPARAVVLAAGSAHS